MGLLSKNKKKAELLREQYLKEVMTMKVFTNGVRVNEKLAGRIATLRDEEREDSPYQPTFQSSTPRPVDYKNNIVAWMQAVREEARKLVHKNKQNQTTLLLD